MKLPPLRALPVFEAVARLNSFSMDAVSTALLQIERASEKLLATGFISPGKPVEEGNGAYSC